MMLSNKNDINLKGIYNHSFYLDTILHKIKNIIIENLNTLQVVNTDQYCITF